MMNRRHSQVRVASTLAIPMMAAADNPQDPELKFQPMHSGRRPEIGMLLYPGPHPCWICSARRRPCPPGATSTSSGRRRLHRVGHRHRASAHLDVRRLSERAGRAFVGGGAWPVRHHERRRDGRLPSPTAARGHHHITSSSVPARSCLALRGHAGVQGDEPLGLPRTLDAVRGDAGRCPRGGGPQPDLRRRRDGGTGPRPGAPRPSSSAEDIAKMTQLAMEYDPGAPFPGGDAEGGGPRGGEEGWATGWGRSTS